MGWLKKTESIAGGMVFPYNAKELVDPRNWIREFKYDKQRKERGWSDRDTWGGGEYIMRVTAGILRALNDDKNPIDWDAYWETNFPTIKKYGYADLGEVAEDIEDYLDFYENTSWTDNLSFELGNWRLDDKGETLEPKYTKAQNTEIKRCIKEYNREERLLYADAQKAMRFVADNLNGLWW